VELGRGKLAVKDQGPGAALQGQHFQLGHFALAQDELGVDLGHALHHAPGHGQAGGAGQFGQLVEVAFLDDAGLGRHGDQQGAGRVRGLARVVAPAGQLFFQGFGGGGEMGAGLVPGAELLHAVGLPGHGRGQQVGLLPLHGVAVGIDGQHDDGVQTQEEQVHEVFLAEAVGREVGVEQTKAAQTVGTGAGAGQFRDQDPACLAHQYHVHAAFTVDEHAQLTPQGARQQRQFPGLVDGIDIGGRETSSGQPVEGLQLAGLEPLQVAFEPGNG